MRRIVLNEDIRPLSDFRADASCCIKHIHNTKRPMVITQRGKGVAVLVDIHEYEALQNKLELLQDINKAEKQIDNKETLSHEASKKFVLKKLRNEN